MANRSASRAFGENSGFRRVNDVIDAMSPNVPIPCAWRGCMNARWQDHVPVCYEHALRISARVWDSTPPAEVRTRPAPAFEPFVYYLMISPTTVKIGTTKCLADRVRQLRSDLQYVVALERGSYEVERKRHTDFRDERRNKAREDFHLSDNLKRHIESLQSDHDELMRIAIERRPITATARTVG